MTLTKPTHVETVLVDADIIAYRCAAATENKPFFETVDAIETLMQYIISETVSFQTEGNVKSFLTGSGNFRYALATTYPYKGNRKDVTKPTHLHAAREYLKDEWGAKILSGFEADDAIAMATVGKDPETTVIASVDKDFKTIPCWMFNFSKVNEADKWTYSTEHSALMYFYEQVLTGDRSDNIVGLKGIGPKKAHKILDGAVDEADMYHRVVKAYEEFCKDGLPLERIVENANLLHLRRHKEDVWQPPS